MSLIKNKMNKWIINLCFIVIFIFMFLWFVIVHPLIVFDADDWTYIGSVREAIPIWGAWNPAKILPEILMPLCGSIARYCVYPIIDNYLVSITVVASFIVAVFILIYLSTFYIMLRESGIGCNVSFLLTVLFCIFHFWILRSLDENNIYMFYCNDFTCYFNYLIPSTLNVSIVFYLNSGREKNNAILIIAIYFAIFSNLASSIILASYMGITMILDYFYEQKESLYCFIKNHVYNMTIIVIWCISAVFELSGGRADMSSKTNIVESIFLSLKNFLGIINRLNRIFIVVAILIIIIYLVGVKRQKRESLNLKIYKNIILSISLLIINFIYILLLCAKVSYLYMTRAEYLFPFFIFGFVVVIFCLAEILNKYKRFIDFIPLCIFIIIFNINTNGHTFLESNTLNAPAKDVYSVGYEILDQIIDADKKKEKEMSLYVPKYDTEDNWPQAFYLGSRISNTLYEHGIISQRINITVVPRN